MQAFVAPAILPFRRQTTVRGAAPRHGTPRVQRQARVRCVDTTRPEQQLTSPQHDQAEPSQPAFDPKTSALLQGIRAVAVGKHGSRPVPHALLPLLREELLLAAKAPPTPPNLDLHLLRASFLGSLFVKAVHTPEESELLSFVAGGKDEVTPVDIITVINPAANPNDQLSGYAVELLSKHLLPKYEAKLLGDLLYKQDHPSDVTRHATKALIAHVMRVRHESTAELCGLAIAARLSVSPDWYLGIEEVELTNEAFVHVAEPFDGTITHDLLTPLLCKHLKEKYGMRPVMAVGKSSGPKYGPNLRDIVEELDVPFCKSAPDVAIQESEFGVAVDQADQSPGLDHWVHMRRVILKRPGIATIEKYVDGCPQGARMFIGSAFHGNYVEKMADVAESVGYDAYIIVGKGLEGSLGLGVGPRRTAELVTGWRDVNGRFRREIVEYNPVEDGGFDEVKDDVVKGSADVRITAERIRRLSKEGSSGNVMFDARTRATLQAFDKALALLVANDVEFVKGAVV